MKKFNKTFRGYNPKEVNAFLDEVIVKLEKIISDSKKKDEIAIAKDKTILFQHQYHYCHEFCL